ncbi:SCP2 sterol-binding domain-containing protein [Methylomicrobium sp. Wu6]|uniref:ubiquinone biosynthesis accessory factor UbiJ n=1 Tax=Methylomicrobium sp. Wu6 TaxID=3107928 RepID=UPI002DD65002|nr:SCP2 sterol-binding domain-containing protein [Methylomicrobium sp. Wu6]MEC4749957.1 SCP2 sterol-binding domain-containing protein [Methylomicrobium sp. Wu6]
MAIKPFLTIALESALNNYLKLDLDVSELLSPLAGKVIELTVEPFGETVYLCPTADAIQVLDAYPAPPATRISGSLWSLGLMGMSAKPMRSVFSGEVKIEGDMTTGRKFQALFDKLNIDLEEKLSHVTGDVIAHQIGNLFRTGSRWTRQSIRTFELNLGEFLQEETRDLPAGPEADIFYRHVDELRADFDRLNCRIERLENVLTRQSLAQSE